MEVRKCVDCGASIEHRGPRAMRCEPCAEKKAKWDRKHAAKADFVFLASDYPGDLKQCRKCKFWLNYGSICNFASLTGQTRLALHKGNADDLYPCKEFEPKERGKCGVDK